MELLYVDPDDICLHRGLVQGQFSPSYQRSFSDPDILQTYSASALAGIGLIHNLAGAGFPLFGTQMYHRLGNQGATSLLAGLAVLMVPIPFILERYGMKLRQKSPWARVHVEHGDEDNGKRDEEVGSSSSPQYE